MNSVGDPLGGLSVHLRREVDGSVLHEEAVVGRDIAELMAELAFDAGLRLNGSPIDLADLEARIRPVYASKASPREAGDVCVGFDLEADSAVGEPTRRFFERAALEPVAIRASRRLVDDGHLSKGDLFFYSIEIAETKIGPLVIEGSASSPPVDVLPIGPLRARSKLVSADPERGRADQAYAIEQQAKSGSAEEHLPAPLSIEETTSLNRPDASSAGHYPVFYSPTALMKAERISRKGASLSPAVETGGLLLGRLHWCPEDRTLFGVVADVLEAAHSEGTTYSLTFTDSTWARVEAVLKARQRNPMTRGERILGQCHGHNFLPFSEGETCDGCPSQGKCPLTTAYLSTSDRIWCRAVFPREPWQLSHVFGLTPRREPTSGLFGQRGGELLRREYYVLDDDFGDE
jgi:hypothetical protein